MKTAEGFYDENLKDYNLLNKVDPSTAKECMKMMELYALQQIKNNVGLGDVSKVLLAYKQFNAEDDLTDNEIVEEKENIELFLS